MAEVVVVVVMGDGGGGGDAGSSDWWVDAAFLVLSCPIAAISVILSRLLMHLVRNSCMLITSAPCSVIK